MKRTGITLLFLLLATLAASSETPQPLCVLSPVTMPQSWRPWGAVQKTLSAARWSDSEAKDVLYSIRRGLDELDDYYLKRPASIPSLGDDAVETFVEVTYAAANMPSLQDLARNRARNTLTKLVTPYVRRSPNSARCDEYETLLPLAIYAHSLYEVDDSRTPVLVALTNSAYRACGSLAAAMGYDYRHRLMARHVSVDHVFDLVVWSVRLIRAELVPGLEVSPAARNLPPTLWQFLKTFPLVGARAYRDGAANEKFYKTAYLATHIVYIPTGVHRYPLYVEDSPAVYQFLRQNFYAVMQMGELDLVAEFVDAFRQYGCAEKNDLQVSDRTRYLLRLFHAAGDSWLAHREPDESKELDDYNTVHKAWTGMLGVRARIPEPAAPGTYGALARRLLQLPH